MGVIVNAGPSRHKSRRRTVARRLNPVCCQPPFTAPSSTTLRRFAMKPACRRSRIFSVTVLAAALAAAQAQAFCGFYVGKADAKLFNEASQVIMARDGERTVISMR